MPDSGRPIRVLHVFRTPVGGLFRHVLDVARGQIARGHQVGIVADSRTGGMQAAAALAELAPSLALGLHRIPISRAPGPGDARAILFMRRLRRAANPDIVHGHGSKGGLLARLPAFFDRTWPAAVYTPHGGTFHYQTNAPRDCLYRGVERLLAIKTDLFLMESVYIAAQMEENLGPVRAPVRIVHNGLVESEFEPVTPQPDPFDVLYLGEMRVLKGVDTLIEALAILKREGKPLRALMVGAGPEEAEFQALAAKLGLASSIAFEAPQPIRSAMARARIMAVPSRNESLPYVVLEAMAAGMPLIATRVGGMAEAFGPAAGRLIPPSDPAALAKALGAILAKTEDQRRAEAGDLVNHVRAGFSYTGMVEGGLAGYREALGRRA
jgi:glycosyltransferase involved in cell wall biosynthesis